MVGKLQIAVCNTYSRYSTASLTLLLTI